MPDINWSKNAVASITSTTLGFNGTRQAENSTSQQLNTTSTNLTSVRFSKSTGRGDPQYGFTRSYMAFDFTGYTTGTITNLTFHWTGTINTIGTNSVFLVKTDAFGNSTNFNNYESDDWWSSLTTTTRYDSGGLGGFSWPDSNSAQSQALGSTAITAAQNDGYLQMAILNSTDYFGLDSGTNVSNFARGNWSSNKFFLRFTYVAGGYSNKVNGVLGEDISKVSAIATANISKVIGVS